MEDEDTHYCLKCGATVIGIENYITHRKVSCESVIDNKIGINLEHDEKNKGSENVQADDFFSSLELQSSSKSSSNMISLSFPNKLSGGIVTRSKSLNVTHQEIPKTEIVPAVKPKSSKKKPASKKKYKKKDSKQQTESITDEIGAFLKKSDDLDDKCSELEKKDDDEWLLFSHLGLKKSTAEDMDDKETKMKSDQQAKRYTPELFSMSPILMPDVLSEGKDDVENFLQDDYDDSYLHIDEMDEFNYAPPRSHTGGKWKPGSLSMRASPILWPGQTWMTLLDDKHQDDDGKTALDEFREMRPPPTHTGGKWKPTAPPSTHTGGKWKPSEVPQMVKSVVPPATHTGGKWKPESRSPTEPPATHTGGKWKPHPGPTHTSGKWKPEEEEPAHHSVDKSAMNAIASAQSTSGKCLKTAGGLIQYYCAPCDRRLASKKMYKKHVLSELHFKRVLQENDLEFDSRSLKIFRGLFTAVGYKERGLGKRIIKRPEHFKNMDMSTGKRIKEVKTDKIKRKKITKRELIRCEICKTKLPHHQLGKHLVSYYHSRRIQLNDPNQQKLVLDNINSIVQQAPFQCGICKFYCNTHLSFKKHWREEDHRDGENKKFWCSFCNFECKTAHMMGLHLDSNSHREVISAVNKSIPIIIRQKTILNCKLCTRTFRYNRELIRHNQLRHGLSDPDHSRTFRCPICKFKSGGFKSLQRHIILSHKSRKKTPYFCSACNITFDSADEAASHRKTQYHKCKSVLKNSEAGKEEEFFMSRLCQYCGKILDDIRKLKDHINDEHANVRPKCSKCGKVFTLPQEVSRHIRDNLCNFSQEETVEEGKKLHKCELCKYSSESKSELIFHEVMHDKVNAGKNAVKLSCPLCHKYFRRNALKVHLRSHTGERPYTCKFCTKSFVRRDRLNLHLKSDHAKEREEMVVEDRLEHEKKDLEELGQSDGEEHSEDKDLERPKCGDPKCKYSPKDFEDLAEHIKIHIGPNLFQCPQCDYKAKTNTLFKRHNKIHLDERSFPCPHCPFRGRLASHLKRHLRLHTGAKPYKCPHCPYKCNILENLRKHVLFTKIHPGKFLYDCKFCSFGTNSAKDFKAHLYSDHFDHFKTDFNITAYIAGIYNQDEDPEDVDSPLPVKKKFVASPKVERPEILKKVSILTRKFQNIRPKPSFIEKRIITPSLKTTGNSIEDKRKVLEMELEKLKQQAKKQTNEVTSTVTLKSYPSLKARKEIAKSDEEMEKSKNDQIYEPVINPPATSEDLECPVTVLTDNNLIYLTIPSSALKSEADEYVMSEPKRKEAFDGNTSPTYIFYNETHMIAEESEEMLVGEEFYVLQD